MRPKNEDSKPGDAIPMSPFRTSLRLRPANEGESAKSTVIGGTGELPAAIFGKEMRRDEGRVEGETSMEFVRTYDYSELGEKLRKFRPDSKNRGKGWFSLEELNERLRKIREEDTKEKEQAWKIGGISFKELRESLKGLKMADDERTKKNSGECISMCVCPWCYMMAIWFE
uniref:Uncharacterized protein LOC105122952 n=1 Tax=Rhizophora mucronata TaxID=61149 RepID=A0A2P2J919_RHIMU